MGMRAWLSDRRQRSSRYDLGAVAFVTIVVAIAGIGMYMMARTAAAFVADRHLRRALATATCADATAELRGIRPDRPQRVRAQSHADALAIAEATAAVRVRNPDLAATALACSSDLGRGSAAARALRAQIADLRARRCLAASDWRCALDHAASATDPADLRAGILAAIRAAAAAHLDAAARDPSLASRIEHEQAALDLWETYLLDAQRSDPPKDVLDLRAALARDRPALDAQLRAEQTRAAAEARRQAAAAERARAQAAAAAERDRRRQPADDARANRPAGRASGGLLCRDGTLSPTCTCGGPHRGCCSHHDGVRGCE